MQSGIPFAWAVEIVGSVERRRDNRQIGSRTEQSARISDRRAELLVFINSGYPRVVVLVAMLRQRWIVLPFRASFQVSTAWNRAPGIVFVSTTKRIPPDTRCGNAGERSPAPSTRENIGLFPTYGDLINVIRPPFRFPAINRFR